MLDLTTIRRLAVLLFVFLAWTPAAYAWSWPAQGPVVEPFSYDEAHPYAAGQHRGIDIGADAAGEAVVAPAAGMVSFAGTVAANGKSVTVETADGYSVTLTHLGSIAVATGETVAEQDAIGTVGPSGTPEVDGPYVHLGIRVTADPNGYVDPLGLLPPVPATAADQGGGSTASQPSTAAPSAAPVTKRASRTPKKPQARTTQPVRADEPAQARAPKTDARPLRSAHRPSESDARASAEAVGASSRGSERGSPARRPVVEPSVFRRAGLDARSDIHTAIPLAPAARPRPSVPTVLIPGLCNGVPALLALAAAFTAARRRRHRGVASAQVLHLPRPAVDHRRVSRAA